VGVIEDIQRITIGRLSAIREFFVGSSLKSLGTPKEEDIYSMARVNKRYPRLGSFFCESENRLNELTGVLEATGERLYPPYTFFNKQALLYLKTTPSVNSKRADQVTEILTGGALNPPQQSGNVIDLGDDTPLNAPDEGGQH
jgi:hypothetical protein